MLAVVATSAGGATALQKKWSLVAAVLGSSIVFLDSTVVNVALPKIGTDLHSSLFGRLEAQTYVYAAYLLSLSALLILAGALSDYYGRRKMFLVGLIGFGATSLLCGLAWNMEALILFRILQGAAGALLVPGSLAIINSTFDGPEQGRAFGIWAGASAATTTLGPFVGGLLVDSISWRMAFLINVPLVVAGIYLTTRYVQESRDEESTGSFDYVGAGIIVLAVGGLVFGVIRGQQHEWHDGVAFISLAIGALATVALPIEMLRAKHPLVPPELFKSRNFTVTNISTLVIYGALYVLFLFVVIFAEGTLGYNAAAAGLIGLPVGVMLALLSPRFGKLAAERGSRPFMTVGPALMGLAVLWLTRLPAASQAWAFGTGVGERLLPPVAYWKDLFPMYVLFAFGLTMMVAPLTSTLMASIPKHNSGVGSAVNNAISRVGPQLAGAGIYVAIVSSFYHGLSTRIPGLQTGSQAFRERIPPLNRPPHVSPALDSAIRASSTHSFHIAVAIAAALLFVGAITNGVGIRNTPPEVEPAEIVPPAVHQRPPAVGMASDPAPAT